MKRTEEIIAALRDIDSHIQPDDYVASGVISDAADRLEELHAAVVEAQGMVSEAILKPSRRTKWLREISDRLLEEMQ
jgi:hypothetical protein